jgi:hypothetical protein
MPDADPQPSGTPTPGESSDAPLAILTACEIAFPPLSSSPEYMQPPRLGIIHLLAWMTVTAMLFKILTTPAPIQPIVWNFHLGTAIFQEILAGAGLVGVGIIILAKIRHTPGYLQPGHLLLLFMCLETTGKMMKREYLLSFPMTDRNYSDYVYVIDVIIITFEVIALFWFATRIPERGRWRIFFRLYALAMLFFFVFELTDFLYYQIVRTHLPLISEYLNLYILFPGIPFVFLPIVVILDIIRGSHRDWLHWLGACILFWEMIRVPISLLARL